MLRRSERAKRAHSLEQYIIIEHLHYLCTYMYMYIQCTNLIVFIEFVIAVITAHIICDIVLMVCSQVGDQLVDQDSFKIRVNACCDISAQGVLP